MDVWEVPVSSCPGLDRGPLMDVGPEYTGEFGLVRRRIVPKRARAQLRGRPISEKALVILECEEACENTELFPSHDTVQQ